MNKLPPNARKVFQGQIFNVYQWEQKMYDGSKDIFERIVRADTVLVIPITPEGKIIICEQEQPHRETPYLSLISGRVEADESPENAAKRELLEETGYQSDQLILFDKHNISDKIDWTIYTFVAKNCKMVAEQNLDPGEKIRCDLVSFEEFIEVLAQGKVKDIHLTVKTLEAKLDPVKMQSLKSLLQ